ncbi:anti-sigma factor family protein [Bacillus pseudomycoides]|uniref:anti-sigma factor domain-containing protein n=1 Tax=Bacillus pseudomycoides TaxID=64104 RepID=UPI0004ED8176|nr:anti-sigma factor domain-containing protein [Bacillus pseudomycoides]AIK36224.1 anti-sigma factor family protein [Bacillus pseudomycoides]AJI17073.1 anti-sigma factor family protein [Bacillus pseudomycoides]
MNKGIVMDIKKHSVVVLTPDGEFITFKRKSHSYMIGEEISFNEQEQRIPRFSIPSFLKPASLLVACFLCVFLFFYNQPEEKALAYVSIDINPSLEASVTKDLRVIDLRACNDDGKRILKEMKRWKNEPLQDVVRTIVKKSQEDGYLTNDKQVMLTAVTKDKSLEPQLEKAMQGLKKEYETKHVTVVYQSSTMQVRENAKKAGFGTGVYIKQENEKKKSLTPPAPPSNQEEHPQEIHSQPKSSPDASSNLSPVKEERYEKQEQIEQKQSQEQQPQQSKGNNGHQQENNGKEYKQKNKESQQENNGKEYKQENKESQQENNGKGYKQENKEFQQENNGKGYKQENKESQQENNGKGYKQENKESQQENKGNINENNGHKKEDKNVPATQHQGKEKKNP